MIKNNKEIYTISDGLGKAKYMIILSALIIYDSYLENYTNKLSIHAGVVI